MVDQIFESAELSFYIGGSALLGEPRNGDCVRRGRPVAEYMYCDAEEAVEATKMPTEARVLWGPVTKQVADAIGVPTAVASVLLRPSSATAEAAARMEALVPANILPTAGDTLKSLVARLAQSEYLHPKSVLSRGNGTGRRKYIDLNSTHYAQPRRVQWGAPMKVRRPQDEHESSSVCLGSQGR